MNLLALEQYCYHSVWTVVIQFKSAGDLRISINLLISVKELQTSVHSGFLFPWNLCLIPSVSIFICQKWYDELSHKAWSLIIMISKLIYPLHLLDCKQLFHSMDWFCRLKMSDSIPAEKWNHHRFICDLFWFCLYVHVPCVCLVFSFCVSIKHYILMCGISCTLFKISILCNPGVAYYLDWRKAIYSLNTTFPSVCSCDQWLAVC